MTVVAAATLQENNFTALEFNEAMVMNVILHTQGGRLTQLKMLLDDRCSVHSLHKLIFADIKNVQYRQHILDHIDKQGGIRRYRWQQVTKKAVEKASQKNGIQRSKSFHKIQSVGLIHRKILSDVDDTFFSSGGRFPAGCDASYPRHVLYPGVLSVYRELDVGRKGIPGNLSFLSARPHVYRNVVEKSAFKRFKQLIAQGDLHCAPTMLAGSLGTGSSMFWGDYGPMGRQKFKNFNEFAKLWPESSFLFIGDNGQADVRVGEMIVEHFPDRVDGIFIHKVQPISQTPGYVANVSELKWKKLNICFFNTYIGLAVEANKRNMIDDVSLENIARSAIEEFNTIDFFSDELYQLALNDLNQDLSAANDRLHVLRGVAAFQSRGGRSGGGRYGGGGYGRNGGQRGSSSSLSSLGSRGSRSSNSSNVDDVRSSKDIYIPFLRAKANAVFAKGDRVITCLGRLGTIEHCARKQDGIYTVCLDTVCLNNSDTRVYAPSLALRRVAPLPSGTPVLTTFGTGVLQSVSPKYNLHAVWLKHVHSTSTTKAYLNKRDVLQTLQAAVGDRVKTKLGEGTVVGYRRDDGMYEIGLGGGLAFWSMLYTQDKLERLPENNDQNRQCSVQ